MHPVYLYLMTIKPEFNPMPVKADQTQNGRLAVGCHREDPWGYLIRRVKFMDLDSLRSSPRVRETTAYIILRKTLQGDLG